MENRGVRVSRTRDQPRAGKRYLKKIREEIAIESAEILIYLNFVFIFCRLWGSLFMPFWWFLLLAAKNV